MKYNTVVIIISFGIISTPINKSIFVDSSAGYFTKTPDNGKGVVVVESGQNVTMTWEYSVAVNETLETITWQVNDGGDGMPKELIAVDKSGVVDHNIVPPDNYKKRIKYRGNASFELLNVDIRDNNVNFICDLYFGFGKGRPDNERHGFKLQVQVPPEIKESLRNQTVNEYDDVTITCEASGKPPPVITWFKDGNSILPSNLPINVTNNTLGELTEVRSSLIITRVSRENTGTYQCYISNGVGENKTSSAALYVRYPPSNTTLSTNKKDNTVISGDSVTLTCSSVARPSANYSFFFNGQFLTISENGTLEIVSVNSAHHGNYSCFSTNQLGWNDSNIVFLNVKVAAKITGATENVLVTENKAVNLSCNASGNPVPNITWTISGSPVTGDNKQVIFTTNQLLFPYERQSVLTISSTNRSDKGVYQCSTFNGIGTQDVSNCSLIVQYIPGPPVIKNITAQAFALVVTWTPPADDGGTTILMYSVKVSLPGQSNWSKIFNTSDSTYNILDLTPNTTYQICISSWNGIGEGECSSYSHATTSLAEPTKEEPSFLDILIDALTLPGVYAVGVGICVILIGLILCICCICCRRRRKRKWQGRGSDAEEANETMLLNETKGNGHPSTSSLSNIGLSNELPDIVTGYEDLNNDNDLPSKRIVDGAYDDVTDTKNSSDGDGVKDMYAKVNKKTTANDSKTEDKPSDTDQYAKVDILKKKKNRGKNENKPAAFDEYAKVDMLKKKKSKGKNENKPGVFDEYAKVDMSNKKKIRAFKQEEIDALKSEFSFPTAGEPSVKKDEEKLDSQEYAKVDMSKKNKNRKGKKENDSAPVLPTGQQSETGNSGRPQLIYANLAELKTGIMKLPIVSDEHSDYASIDHNAKAPPEVDDKKSSEEETAYANTAELLK